MIALANRPGLLGPGAAVSHPPSQSRFEILSRIRCGRLGARGGRDGLELPLERAALAAHCQVQAHRQAPRERHLGQLSPGD